MTDVLYLKWTVPCRLGKKTSQESALQLSYFTCENTNYGSCSPQILEQSCAWNGNSAYPLSSLVSRKIKVKYSLLLGFAQFSGQKSPSLPQGRTWSQYLHILQCLQSPTLISRLLYFFKTQNRSLQKRKIMFQLFCFITKLTTHLQCIKWTIKCHYTSTVSLWSPQYSWEM